MTPPPRPSTLKPPPRPSERAAASPPEMVPCTACGDIVDREAMTEAPQVLCELWKKKDATGKRCPYAPDLIRFDLPPLPRKPLQPPGQPIKTLPKKQREEIQLQLYGKADG